MREEWRPVMDWEGFYEVSNSGEVRSLKRFIKHGRGKNAFRLIKERILKPVLSNGHLVVGLCKDRKSRNYGVHVLVLTAFKGSRPPGLEGRHLDGDATNNKIKNLAWGTHLQNMQDKILHGTSKAKLTWREVYYVRCSNKLQFQLAQELGVSRATISLIKARKTYI